MRTDRRLRGSRRLLRSKVLVPGGLLAVAAVASLAMFVPDAGASGHSDASSVIVSPTHVTTRSCGTVNTKGVTHSTPNAGNPFLSSSRFCLNGHLISYGSRYITYDNPPQSFIDAGRLLFAQACSSCHGNQANGVGPEGQASIGPNLQGVGAATVDFWVSTGRMPAADVKAVEAERRATRLTPLQALELAAWVNSLDPSVPAVPTPHTAGAEPVRGAEPLLAQLRGLPHHRGDR